MKRAFTLIELLVVIAIIAILAAILFPVFAQAKEAAKKTQYISNIKQTGTSSLIYMGDTDDVWPHAYMVRDTGTWATGVVTPVPSNSVQTAPWTNPIRIENGKCFWANALQPYMKNYEMFKMPGATTSGVAGEIPTAGVAEVQMGIVMNGLLNNFSGTAVVNSSVVPAYWHIQKLNFVRRGLSSPALQCPGGTAASTPPCLFNPTGNPLAASAGGDTGYVFNFVDPVWQFGGRRGIVTRTDSSTKSMPMGTAVSPAFVGFAGKLSDAYAAVGTTGTPASYWTCDYTFNSQSTTGNYWAYFRPDRSE